jgi:hypothetical protein
MSEIKNIQLPDIGDFDEVEVIEILVSVGDTIEAGIKSPSLILSPNVTLISITLPATGVGISIEALSLSKVIILSSAR